MPSQMLTICSRCAFPGHDDAVNFLLRHFRHVHIDQCNKLGFTALMKAAIQGRTRCAKLLLFAGNDYCNDNNGMALDGHC